MYRSLLNSQADEENDVPAAQPAETAAPVPVARAASVASGSSIRYAGPNEALRRTCVVIPPQASQVIAQCVLAILCMLLGLAAFVLEIYIAGDKASYQHDPVYPGYVSPDKADNDDFHLGPAISGFVPACIIFCIAVPIMCQTICMKRFGKNALDLNSSLSCQVTMLTTVLTISIFIDVAAFFLALAFNADTMKGKVYSGFLAVMALFNFIGAILGCCATCSSSCGGCCNCNACCVTKPANYPLG